MIEKDAAQVHVKLVLATALADGHLDDLEAAWTREVSDRLGQSFSESLASVSMSPEEAQAALPDSKVDRAIIWKDCFVCAFADGDLHENEASFIGIIANVLGFSSDEAEKLLLMCMGWRTDVYTLDELNSEIRKAFA